MSKSEEMPIIDKLYFELIKIPGANLFDTEEPDSRRPWHHFAELKIYSRAEIEQAKEIIEKYGYEIFYEEESEGSDYTAYLIYFDEKTKK